MRLARGERRVARTKSANKNECGSTCKTSPGCIFRVHSESPTRRRILVVRPPRPARTFATGCSECVCGRNRRSVGNAVNTLQPCLIDDDDDDDGREVLNFF